METVSLAGLMKIELPAHTVRLCDGGRIIWGLESYTAQDSVFGSIAGMEPLTEGVGDEVPALQISLLPSDGVAVSELSQPGYQTSRVRFWIAEFNPATAQVIGTPALQFDGQLDQTILKVSKSARELGISVVSTAERLFNKADGNTLSPTFRRSVWPGEAGDDEATGLSIPVAWGVESPNGASTVPMAFVGFGYREK